MQYNNESKIKTVDEVKEFFHHLVNERKVNFHPDDRFEDYLSPRDGHNMFTLEECALYNHLMDESFEICEKNNADIYAIGLDFLQLANG